MRRAAPGPNAVESPDRVDRRGRIRPLVACWVAAVATGVGAVWYGLGATTEPGFGDPPLYVPPPTLAGPRLVVPTPYPSVHSAHRPARPDRPPTVRTAGGAATDVPAGATSAEGARRPTGGRPSTTTPAATGSPVSPPGTSTASPVRSPVESVTASAPTIAATRAVDCVGGHAVAVFHTDRDVGFTDIRPASGYQAAVSDATNGRVLRLTGPADACTAHAYWVDDVAHLDVVQTVVR